MQNANSNALTSVSPDNPGMGQDPSSNNGTGSDNLTSNLSIPNVPVPGSNPITQNANSVASGMNADATNRLAQVTQQGDQQVAQASQSKGSGKGGVGSILGPIATIGSKFLSQGGPVAMAEGGVPDTIEPPGVPLNYNPNDPTHAAIGLGYLIGALHQRDFGGTPQTLPEAAKKIQNFLSTKGTGSGGKDMGFIEPPAGVGFQAKAEGGYAGGGNVTPDATNNDTQLAQEALNRALGLTNTSEDQAANASPPGISTQSANAMQSGMNPMQMQQQIQQSTPQPNIQAPQGYAQRFAMGGSPQMAPGGDQPPLQPGQMFQGDGSVKGPGGPTDDAIPAKLSNGEFVFSVPAVQFFGVDKLVKMNEQGKQGYMQALGQVQQNQQKGPAAAAPQGAPPAAAAMPPAGPSQQQPMMQAGGGPATSSNSQGMASSNPTMRNKSHGYCGL